LHSAKAQNNHKTRLFWNISINLANNAMPSVQLRNW